MAICRLRALSSLSNCKFSSPFQSFQIRRFSSSQVPSLLENVGFIGLGNMGSRMANNLIKAGYRVSVYDVNSDVIRMFSQMGVTTKKTPYEVAEASDVVITMLPSSAHVIDVYTGPNGLLHGGKLLRPWLLIDSSTIDPQTSRNLSATVSNCIVKEKKGNWGNPVKLDAPVSGSVIAAEAGTLTFMVGGSEEAFLSAKTLFLSMGKSAIYCGRAGSGSGVSHSMEAPAVLVLHLHMSNTKRIKLAISFQKFNSRAAKVCNNLAMAVSMLGVSEALALGQSLGVAASTLTKILNCSSGRCWSSDTYNPVPGVMEGVPSSRDYCGGFASKLMVKDLNLAAESAKEVGCKYPLTSQAQEIYTELCRGDYEAKDFSCAFRHYYSGREDPLDK